MTTHEFYHFSVCPRLSLTPRWLVPFLRCVFPRTFSLRGSYVVLPVFFFPPGLGNPMFVFRYVSLAPSDFYLWYEEICVSYSPRLLYDWLGVWLGGMVGMRPSKVYLPFNGRFQPVRYSWVGRVGICVASFF